MIGVFYYKVIGENTHRNLIGFLTNLKRFSLEPCREISAEPQQPISASGLKTYQTDLPSNFYSALRL
jgi:hypothetical protein